MAQVAEPTTRSPGKLALIYSYVDSTHQASVNYIDGVDMNDGSAAATDAANLAAVVAACLTASATITGWKTLGPDGQTYLVGSFNPAIVGYHAHNTNDSPYKSHTIKVLGRGAATVVEAGSGVCSFLLFIRDALDPSPGQKYLTGTLDAAITALMADLNNNLRYWADYYGQHADCTGRVAVQFHAHIQKKLGL